MALGIKVAHRPKERHGLPPLCHPDRPYHAQEMCRSCYRKVHGHWTKNTEKTKRASENATLKSNYGITIEDYERMAQEQNERCAICGKQPFYPKRKRLLVVDHNHETGQVRALLCQRCNLMVGFIEATPQRIQQIQHYLAIHSQSPLTQSPEEAIVSHGGSIQ